MGSVGVERENWICPRCGSKNTKFNRDITFPGYKCLQCGLDYAVFGNLVAWPGTSGGHAREPEKKDAEKKVVR
jgi:hypothetical protein